MPIKSGYKTQVGPGLGQPRERLTACALRPTDEGKIDSILLDMTFPGASSPEVVAEAARVRPDIKVIVTSAHSRGTIMDKMRASHICGFIRKPFRLVGLTKMLQDVVVS